MAEKRLKKAKYSKNQTKEKELTSTLILLLEGADVLPQITAGDDNFPNIDGYFYLLNKERDITGQMLQVQIKSLASNAAGTGFSAKCRTTLLAHAQGASNPVLLIGVDAVKNIAYWSYLSPEFVARFVEQKGTSQGSTTIHFPAKNKIEAGKGDFVKEWRNICRHHRNESNDKIIAHLLNEMGSKYSYEKTTPARLETLRHLAFYRTTSGDFPAIEPILSLAPAVYESPSESKIAYIETLEQIFYHRLEEVLKILYQLIISDEQTFDSVKKVLTSGAKYNYHILTSFGYSPQRTFLDTIDVLLKADQINLKLLTIEILGNMLNANFEGTSSKGYTITFHRGALQGTPFLAKIRREAIDRLLVLADSDEPLEIRLAALQELSHALHSADSGIPDEKLVEILNKDTSYIVSWYRKLVLDSKGDPIECFPVVYQVERQLALLKVWKRTAPEISPLLMALRECKNDYRFYRLLAGEEHDLRIELGFNKAREQKEKEIVKNLDLINESNIGAWFFRLEKVAAYKDNAEFWRYNTFRDFLARIAVQKPGIADKLLTLIFEKKGPLYDFAGSLVFGLRKSGIARWDKYVEKIKDNKSKELTESILTSFEAFPWNENPMRSEDTVLLTDIAKAENGFSFLEKFAEDRSLRYNVFRALLFSYSKNPELFRKELLEQMTIFPQYEASFFDQIGMAIFTEWFTFDGWDSAELGVIADLLIESREHDHNHDQVMHELGKRDFELMMSIYDRRLSHEAKTRGSHYRAIAYRINPELVTFIHEHPKYDSILRTWISKAGSKRYDLYNMHLSKLVDQVGGDAYAKAVQEIIKSGKDAELKKLISLFPFSEPPDFDICFQIVDATDNKDIWRSVSGSMQTTGTLGGHIKDNIFGNALRRIKIAFETKLQNNPSDRIRKFCEMTIKNLDAQIKDADERHSKEMKRMEAEETADED